MNDYYQTLVESKLDPVGESGDNVIYRCPQCERHTGSGHLYVNYKKNVYNCFKCNLSGRDIRRLLYEIGYSRESISNAPIDLITMSKNKSVDPLSMIDDILVPKKKVLQDYSMDLRVLTSYWMNHTKQLSIDAYEYLLSRGVTDQQILQYNIREGIDRSGEELKIYHKSYIGRNYSGRIIVPSIHKDDGLISFYVARDYLGRNNIAKYLNPPQDLAYSSEDVWNLYNIDDTDSDVIICEGVFTAIAVSSIFKNVVATYGKSISAKSNNRSEDVEITSQGDKLLSKRFNKYIVAYDADATESLISTCEYLRMRGANTYYIKVPDTYGPHTDLSDFSIDDRVSLIKSMKKYDQSTRLSLSYDI